MRSKAQRVGRVALCTEPMAQQRHRLGIVGHGPVALKQGREIADATAAERLFQRAIGFSHEVEKAVQSGGKPATVKYTEHYPPDTPTPRRWSSG